MSMLICQPPVKAMRVGTDYCDWVCHDKAPVRHLVVNETGITIGDLYQVTAEWLEYCPFGDGQPVICFRTLNERDNAWLKERSANGGDRAWLKKREAERVGALHGRWAEDEEL